MKKATCSNIVVWKRKQYKKANQLTVREPSDLLDEMHVKRFMELTRRAGLEYRLTNVTNVTIFAPTDQAFDGTCVCVCVCVRARV